MSEPIEGPRPTPWRIAARSGLFDEAKDEWDADAGPVTRIVGADGSHVCGTCDGCNNIALPDAALILRAVNAHAALVAAVEIAKRAFYTVDKSFPDTLLGNISVENYRKLTDSLKLAGAEPKL